MGKTSNDMVGYFSNIEIDVLLIQGRGLGEGPRRQERRASFAKERPLVYKTNVLSPVSYYRD